ncbi:hypothetical protein HDU67_006788 [Dinochytrium kinnereticum]|nr:hypothetical protein HDU67_006788 [Dinochytrium kinnereticum]
MLDRTNSLPVGSSEEVGAALISGLSQNFTNFLFTHEGMLCSGQYFSNSYFTTQCLVGKSQCKSSNFTVDPSTGLPTFHHQPDESNKVPLPYTQDRLNVSQLRIKSTSANTFQHPTNPTRVGVALSGLNIKYSYTSKSAIPYSNIELWRPTSPQGPYTRDSKSASAAPLVRIYNPIGTPTDHWVGICHQSIQRCNLTIANGRTSSLTACTDQSFNCWDRRGEPSACEDKIGIGEIWRADNVVSSTILNIMRKNSQSTDFSLLMESAISRLSLAWISSALPLDLSSNLRFIVYQPLELATTDPQDAVAIDLILLTTLGVGLVALLVTYLAIWIITAIGTLDPAYESRKVKWDAIEKYAALLCQRGELVSSRPIPVEGVSAKQKVCKNRYEKVESGNGPIIMVTSHAEEDETIGSPSRSRLTSVMSIRRTGKAIKAASVGGEQDKTVEACKKPLYQVLFTREGYDRLCEMLGERPRHVSPKKVYVISTLRGTVKKVA